MGAPVATQVLFIQADNGRDSAEPYNQGRRGTQLVKQNTAAAINLEESEHPKSGSELHTPQGMKKKCQKRRDSEKLLLIYRIL